MDINKKQWRRLLLSVAVGLLLSLGHSVVPFWNGGWPVAAQMLVEDRPSAEAIGRSLYQSGQYEAAVTQWQSIVDTHAIGQNSLAQASALSNLSLSYQQLGQWDQAQQAIEESLHLLRSQDETTVDSLAAWARALMAQGSLQLSLGKTEQALAQWQQAEAVYKQSHNVVGTYRAQLNQAQALRALGFYRQALETLVEVTDRLEGQPPSVLQAIALRRLGEALRLSGQLSASETALTQSLSIAQQTNAPADISAALLSLGHTAQSQAKLTEASDFYINAMDSLDDSAPVAQQVPIELAQLDLAITTADMASVHRLWPRLQQQFSQLPTSRNTLYQQINWANSLLKLRQTYPTFEGLDLPMLAQQLQHVTTQARQLGDQRAEAYALGTLGHAYEQNKQWTTAQRLTQRALSLSDAESARDMAYQWQWQMGRLWKEQDNPAHSVSDALNAYTQAIETLSQLRGDLSATDGSTQFSFKENVEPVYRQLVSLLLQTEPESPDYQQNLANAQTVIESLRLAELDNYFQEACVEVDPIDINQADDQAAVVYTLVLEDRLSVLLHLPNQPIQHFSTLVAAQEVNDVVSQMRQQLVVRSRREYLGLGEQLYDWLLAPAREAIDASGVDTLVFVLDGPLQSVPMATLYDGDRFLIEDYGVALTPGVELLNPQPWNADNLRALIAGITESRQGLPSLPYVADEVGEISDSVRDRTVLIDQQFTSKALTDRLKSTLYPIVHVATHGQFSSSSDETYLLAWDELINVREVSQILQANLGDREGIELLVLSACETASGDRRAALGLSGVAIKAGARSTLGSLWSVNDQVTSEFMGYFYQRLTQPGITRAEALRAAQLHLINDLNYRHPAYWAPYVLIGSWL